jgi:hypothetical protein
VPCRAENHSHVLLGAANGTWSCRRADGTRDVIERQNPYHQAFTSKMALSDDMEALTAREASVPRSAGGRTTSCSE